MFLKRNFAWAIVLGVIAMSFAGCRNRCQPCGVPYQQPYLNQYGYNTAPGVAPPYGQQFGVAARSPVIPPPGTGTLNIPSLARNNPFGANQNRGLLNTNQAAPTPANRSARFNFQNGWQPVNGNTGQPVAPTNNGQQNGSTTLGNNLPAVGTGTNPVASPAARSVLVQDTQSRANEGYGDSFVRSPDYSTTATNETVDRTRLPATDASNVRAPSQYYARASGVQVAQFPQQNFVVAGQQPYYTGTFGAPGQIGPAGVLAANTSVVVQDQGTATYDPYGNSRSADWRNRDSSSSTFQ